MAVVVTGPGDDVVNGTDKRDRIRGLGGDDRIAGREDDDTLWGGDGADVLLGGSGDDFLWGDAGQDQLLGQSGDDRLYVRGEGDVADGGPGRDRASYLRSDGGVGVDLGAGTGPDSLTGIEDLDGSQHGDTLLGDAGANRLRGLGGVDVLFGGEGDDTLIGGEYGDRLEGGAGDDVLVGGRDPHLFRDDLFVFQASGGSSPSGLPDLGDDLIADFEPGQDFLGVAVFWSGGGWSGSALFDRLDTDADGSWTAADDAISVASVRYGGVRAASLVVDLGGAVDPSGGFDAVITFWGLTALVRSDVTDTGA